MAVISLLEACRNFLDITWSDADGDRKLAGMLARGERRLEQVAGGPLTFEAEGPARELLFNYVMYDREGKLHEFFDNYLSELLNLQIQAEVKRYRESGSADV